ncbi:hypothetical protein E2320_022097, partial [Naja naja]
WSQKTEEDQKHQKQHDSCLVILITFPPRTEIKVYAEIDLKICCAEAELQLVGQQPQIWNDKVTIKLFAVLEIKISFLQLGVGFEFSQGERRIYPSFFQINPKESPQYVGLVQLLLYFQWNWVGLVAPENDNGERFISTLTPMLQEKEICLAFIEMMKLDFLITIILKLLNIFKTWCKSEVIILFGESNSIINVLSAMNAYKQETRTSFCKVWILTCHWKVSVVGPHRGCLGIQPFPPVFRPLNPQGTLSLKNGVMLLLMLMLFWLLAPTTAKRLQTICVFKGYIQLDESYYRPGDVIIGGNLPLGIIAKSPVLNFNTVNLPLQKTLTISNYLQFLALMFAISEVNKEFLLLPNITLGFHIYGHFQREIFISLNSLSMLSSRGQVVPGYKCDQQDTLLEYLFLQLGVGFEFSQGEKRVYSSFFRINPKESPQYVGLVQLLLHFQWNWVGLVAPEDDRGERFVSSLMPMLKEKEICLASIEILKLDDIQITVKTLVHIFQTWSTEVFILFADSGVTVGVAVAVHFFEKFIKVSLRKVFIYTSHWKLGMGQSEDKLQVIKLFHGVLHFRYHSRDVSEFSHFLLLLDPLNPQGDVFLPPWDYIKSKESSYRPGDLIIAGNLPLGSIAKSPDLNFYTADMTFKNVSVLALSSLREREEFILPSSRLIPRNLLTMWNCIGLMAPEDDRGEHFVSTLMPKIQEKEICLAFILMLELSVIEITQDKLIHNFLPWSKAKVFILFGDSIVTFNVIGVVHFLKKNSKYHLGKFASSLPNGNLVWKNLNTHCISMGDHSGDASEFSHFLLSLDPLNPQGNAFLPPWDYIKSKESSYRPGDLIIAGNLPLGSIAKSPDLNFYTADMTFKNVPQMLKLEAPHMNFFSYWLNPLTMNWKTIGGFFHGSHRNDLFISKICLSVKKILAQRNYLKPHVAKYHKRKFLKLNLDSVMKLLVFLVKLELETMPSDKGKIFSFRKGCGSVTSLLLQEETPVPNSNIHGYVLKASVLNPSGDVTYF